MFGVGFGITKVTSRSGVVSDSNLMSGSWIAGASTTLTITGGQARAVAQSGGVNPRIYKVINTTIGHTYRAVGTITAQAGQTEFFRVSENNTLNAPLALEVSTTTTAFVNATFVATKSVYYVGIVQVVDTIGEFGSIDDNFLIRDEAAVSSMYFDSVSGNNSNDGRTALTPKQTIASQPVIFNNTRIFLKRNSYWREELNSVSATGVAVQAYGSGTLPVLDASNITANSGWVQEGGGNTSCYTKTLSHTGAAGLYMSLWIDNVRPKWYATIAECQANPGSFTVGLSTGTSNVFTVHPFGSTNPNTDGKVYEYSARNYGCVTGGNSQVTAIRTKKQIHNNGSGSFGINNIVSDCVFEDGVKHNAYGSPGTTFNNCIAWKCDWPKRDGWIGIVLHSTVATGKTGTLRGCMSRIGIPQRDYGIAQGQATTAFYAHTAGASTDDNWDTINYFDCSSSGAESAFSVGDTNILNVERCFSEDAGSPFSLFAQNNNLIDGWATNPAGRQIQRLVSISSTSGANTVIDGLRFYTTLANDGDIYTTANGGTLNMGNSAIVRGPGNGSPHYLFRSEGDKVVNLGGNIFHFDVSNGGAYLTSKNNSLWNNNVITGTDQGNFIINTVEYETYPLFVTGVPALALGTYLDTNPQMVNPANGDFHVIPGTQSSLINAGCLRFPNYTTVPSDAAIGAM